MPFPWPLLVPWACGPSSFAIAPPSDHVVDDTVLFDPTSVARVSLTLTPDALATLVADPESEAYVPADLHFVDPSGHDDTVDSIGLRFKGNASLNAALPKNPLKLKFDEYVEGRSFAGLAKVSLGTEYGDPTFLRESTSYALLAEAGLPAPRTRPVTVTVNGEPWGLYLLTEELDDPYLARQGLDPAGTLYEAGRLPFLYWGDDPDLYAGGNGTFDVQSGEGDGSSLVALARILSQAPDADLAPALSDALDVDDWLLLLAADALLVNLDSPLFSAANAYVYEDPADGRLRVLAWDMDNAFGAFPTFVSPSDKAALSPWSPKLTPDPRPLVDRVLSVPELQATYLADLSTLRDGPFDSEAIRARLAASWTVIVTDYATDPHRIYPWDTVVAALSDDTAIEDAARRYPEPVPGLTSFLTQRDAAIDAALNAPPAWPASVRFDLGAAEVTVTGDPPGRWYAFLQARTGDDAPWSTLASRAHESDEAGWSDTWPVAWPTTTTALRLVVFSDLDHDAWADPGRDTWAVVDVPTVLTPGETWHVEATPDRTWDGDALALTVFGAPIP